MIMCWCCCANLHQHERDLISLRGLKMSLLRHYLEGLRQAIAFQLMKKNAQGKQLTGI